MEDFQLFDNLYFVLTIRGKCVIIYLVISSLFLFGAAIARTFNAVVSTTSKEEQCRTMKRNENSNPHVFIHLILPYACVLLVPILIWVLSNFYVIQNNEEKMIALVKSSLENNVNMVDAHLNQVEDVIYRMSQNTAFQVFYEKPALTFIEITDIQKILSSYFIEDGLTDELYMYSRTSGFLIDPKSFYRSVRDFVTVYHPAGGRNPAAWEAGFNEALWRNGYGCQETMLENGRELLVIPYTRTMPLSYPGRREGSITALINVEKLLSYFDSLLEEGSGGLYVLDAHDEVVMHRGEDYGTEVLSGADSREFSRKVKTGGKKLYQFTLTSSKTQWRYCILLDRAYIMRDMTVVNNILSTVNILAFLLGGVLCVYFTYGRNKSYLRIMHMLGIEKKSIPLSGFRNNEFEFWKPYIGNLLDENRRIKENMDKLGDESDYRVLHMLLSGHAGDEAAAQALLADSRLALRGQYYLVLALRTEAMYNLEGESNKNIFLSHALEEFLEGELYIYVADAKTMAVLLSFDTEPGLFCRSLKNQLVNMNLEVFHRYRMEVLMGAGRAADSLCGIAESYAQALEVVSYNRMTGSTDKLFYEELPQEQNMYYYPIELENSLITAISGGKAVEASKILNTIYEENFVRRSLSGARISELIGEVYSSLNKVRQTYFKDEERMSYRLSDFTIRGFFEYARDFVFAACENMKVYEENAHNAQFKKMLEYINENYSRNDLSRDTLASAFGLTDITYISKMFKRFMNENFSSYLERIRIEKACDLLDSHRPVKEVAEAVGYLSDISFRRAFKKRMGMSPSEYISRPGPAGGTGSGSKKLTAF